MYRFCFGNSIRRSGIVHLCVGAFGWNRCKRNRIVRRCLHGNSDIKPGRMYHNAHIQHYAASGMECNHVGNAGNRR